MDRSCPDVRLEAVTRRCGRAAVMVVLVVAALNWVGWTTGIELLTRVHPTWPQMTPWTALWLAALALAILVQLGYPSRDCVWIGRGFATLIGVHSLVVLVEYATTRSFGLDQVWFVRRAYRDDGSPGAE